MSDIWLARLALIEFHSPDKASFTGPAGVRVADTTALKVTDDFPEIPAVLDRELGAIETFLGALLDEMLGVD